MLEAISESDLSDRLAARDAFRRSLPWLYDLLGIGSVLSFHDSRNRWRLRFVRLANFTPRHARRPRPDCQQSQPGQATTAEHEPGNQSGQQLNGNVHCRPDRIVDVAFVLNDFQP